MTKKVFIIHGWAGNPQEGWFPWMKKELEARGFQVEVPAMPDADHPKIETWVPFLAKQVGKLDEDTYFVGHSVGCQTILRFLERAKGKVGGCIFIGGWLSLQGLETAEEKEIARPWLETPIDFDKVKKATTKFTAIFSDDDPFVPISNTEFFKKNLGAKIIVEHGKGHFNDESNVKELPAALKALLRIAK